MGTRLEWNCSSCGAGETWQFGGGMNGFNTESTARAAAKGRLGEIMRFLLGENGPKGLVAFDSKASFYCENCGCVIPGKIIELSLGDDAPLYYFDIPPCPHCENTHALSSNRFPVTEREADLTLENYLTCGCPQCGAQTVDAKEACWD